LAVKFFIAFHLLYTPKSAQLNVFKSIIFVAVNSDYGKKTFLVLQRGVPEDAPRDPGAAYASFSLKNRYRCWGLRCRFANRWTTGGAEQAGKGPGRSAAAGRGAEQGQRDDVCVAAIGKSFLSAPHQKLYVLLRR
jgi:hypothetical protein